jgi:ferredoxin
MRQQGAIGWFKHDVTHRGITAWGLAVVFLAFYVVLYWGGQKVFGVDVPNLVGDFAKWFAATTGIGKGWMNKWTIYGGLYSIAIVGGGLYMLKKYGHNRYQVIRTLVVMVTQVSFGFSIPILLKLAGQPEYYFSYLWPLKIEYLFPSNLAYFPLYMAVYSTIGSMVIVPLLSVLFGKRWYCSWICGCGGLANTFGEPWRHLSNKSNAAWTFEKWSIHSTLALSFVLTAAMGLSYLVGDSNPELQETVGTFRKGYFFIVVSILSGIVGVAAYPIGGTRVWCRFFCPMAALIGLVQKFGRYRITVKENMCISCGLCSKYCEMGIDVRAYAQRNQSFVRASCVGCGLCAEVCPRGVLRLENKWDQDPQELSMSSFLSESYKRDAHRKAA